MNEYKMTSMMEKQLDGFLAEKTITDVDRTKFVPFVLRDPRYKLTICLMFNCNCHSYEDPTIINCQYTGSVIHLPAFWIEVPKELAYNYLLDTINDLYKDTYADWIRSGLTLNSPPNTTIPSGGNNCNCGCNPDGWHEV